MPRILYLSFLALFLAPFLVGGVVADDLPGEFVVTDLRKDEINYYGLDGSRVDRLTRTETVAAPGEIRVLSYSPKYMKVQLQVPGRDEEDIFVLVSDIEVEPGDAWAKKKAALDDRGLEGICLGDTEPSQSGSSDERIHAGRALFSCR